MAKREIDLNIVDVENREMRLGSIISWDGSAKELVENSRYEIRSRDKRKSVEGCAGKKKKAAACAS